MYGINPLTMECYYRTPCGWCVKWDKKCDKKSGRSYESSEKTSKVNLWEEWEKGQITI